MVVGVCGKHTDTVDARSSGCVGATRVTDTVACCSDIGNMLEYLDIFSGSAACRFMIACDRRLKLRCTEDGLRSIGKRATRPGDGCPSYRSSYPVFDRNHIISGCNLPSCPRESLPIVNPAPPKFAEAGKNEERIVQKHLGRRLDCPSRPTASQPLAT